MITADNITDKQIRELRALAFARFQRGADTATDRETFKLTDWALERGHVQRYAARARCAEILNARAKGTP